MANDTISERYDVVVVGGGHNGLVAASYLARAGLTVLVLERAAATGGATVSAKAFTGVPVQVSRFASLVGHFPQAIIDDLELSMVLRARPVASYTPVHRDRTHRGLLVERSPGSATADSFRAVTRSDREYDAWRAFRGMVADLSRVVTPTLLEPLPDARDLRARLDAATWDALVEQPLGAVVEDRFADDAVRGLVVADALTSTFADVHDASLSANRAFVHHHLGDGEWRVPVGGMGAVGEALAASAHSAGVQVLTEARVSGIESDHKTAVVTWSGPDGWRSAECDWVLCDVAPSTLQLLLGEEEDGDLGQDETVEGSQLIITMVVDRLPRVRSGVTPRTAFAGSFHARQGLAELQDAYRRASAGSFPSAIPGELRCHSLTDPSIVGPLAEQGAHTLTYIGVQLPGRLFAADVNGFRDAAVARALEEVNGFLEEPLESLLHLDRLDQPCLEAWAPQDVERALGLPGGHPHHGDLSWPWVGHRARLDTAAQQWGVDTDLDNVLLCGAGARRGGLVTGVAGHNAAHALLQSRSRS